MPHPLEPRPVREAPEPKKGPELPLDDLTTYRRFHKSFKLPSKRGHLGVEIVGGHFHVLIPANAPTPATGAQIFTSVHDNQKDLSFVCLEGFGKMAYENRLLGYFDMVNIPPAPKETPRVLVTFVVTKENGDEFLHVSARDLDNGRQEQWEKNGGGLIGRIIESTGMKEVFL